LETEVSEETFGGASKAKTEVLVDSQANDEPEEDLPF
jgi:hypothetical protein